MIFSISGNMRAAFLIALAGALKQSIALMVETTKSVKIESAVDKFGLDNCTYLYIEPVFSAYRNYDWALYDIQTNTSSIFYEGGGDRYINGFCNSKDELIFNAYDNSTSSPKLILINLLNSSVYELDFPNFTLAAFAPQQTLLIDSEGPDYRILSGKVTLNDWQ